MKKVMKKSLVMLIVLTMVSTTALTGCGKKEKNNTGKQGNTTDTAKGLTIDVHVGPEPETIDPSINATIDGASPKNEKRITKSPRRFKCQRI